MDIYISNKIKIMNPTTEFMGFVRTNYTFNNPEYYKRQAQGKSTWRINPNIYMYEKGSNYILLPFGAFRKVYCAFYNKATFHNEIMPIRARNYNSCINPYDYQERAINNVLGAKNGILVSPCGSGKTQMGLEIVAKIGGKALWIAHTKDLVNQSMERAKNNFKIDNSEYGLISDGKINIGNTITFATIQTLNSIDLTEYKNEWDVVMVDECYSGDTEILTENGFVRFDELSKDVKVAEYDDGKINFVKPIRYINKKVDSYVSFKGIASDVEIKTTLHHNMIAYDTESNRIVERQAMDLINKKCRSYAFIKHGNINEEPNQFLTPYERLLIMVQADGCVYHRGKNDDTYKLEFSKQRKIDRFKYLCNESGVEYKEYAPRIFDNKKWKTSYKFTIHLEHNSTDYKQLASFLKKPMNSQYAMDILDEIKNWDGHIRPHNHGTEYDSTIRENVEFVELCAIYSNMNYSRILTIPKRYPHSESYRIIYNMVDNMSYGRFNKTIINEPLQTYCVEVPKHKIIVKKDGFVFVCGNCQHVAGTPTNLMMFYNVLNKLSARYKIGLTATPYRSDGLNQAMFCVMGNIIYEVPKSAVKEKTCDVEVRVIKSKYKPNIDNITLGDGTLNYSSLISDITHDNERNNHIGNIINSLGGSCLILSDRIEHLQELYNAVISQNKAIIKASNTKHDKLMRESAMDKMKSGELQYLFASYKLACEGLDIPNLQHLVMATPVKDKRIVVQSCGRVGRKAEGKEKGIVIDFVDDFGMLKGYAKKRQSYYKSLKYDIKIID